MSSLRPPFLGPIVGHTTANSCRLWIKAKDPADKGGSLAEDRRTIGIITVLDENGRPDLNDSTRTHYFRLHREYDRTGTFNLGVDKGIGDKAEPSRLQPDTIYRVRMGTLTLDDAFPNDESVNDKSIARYLPDPSIWAESLRRLPERQSEATFRTSPKGNVAEFSFLLGSCHYPGILWKKKESDKIFRPMYELVADRLSNEGPAFVLMVGDQIYADTLNRYIPIGRADTYDEFQERYNNAFGSPNLRVLMRNLATYMILDDHEIEDNWTQDRINESDKRWLFHLAIGAYMSYQWSHGPRNYDLRLFYSFEYGGYPFFVLDERTQRYKDDEDDINDNYLLGRPSLDPNEPSQLDHLCRWLSDQQKKIGDRPKFIVSPTVFVPNPIETTKGISKRNKSDSWPAFPQTRRHLLNHIVKNRIQNIVFLSGDIHCSNVAEINFSGSAEAEALRALSITSSAFYWPFPFADGEPSHYVHDSKKRGQKDTFKISRGISMDYKAYHFTQENNFCNIIVNWKKKMILVRAIDQTGELIVESSLKLA